MTLMWDPSGRILTQTAAEAVRVDAPPRAKQYKHVAQGSDLMAVFRDQYTPWDFSLHTEGLDVEQHVGALLLRLPLSGEAGKEGAQLDGGRASLEEVEACLAEFESAARSLLFLRRVQVSRCAHLSLCSASHPWFPALHLTYGPLDVQEISVRHFRHSPAAPVALSVAAQEADTPLLGPVGQPEADTLSARSTAPSPEPAAPASTLCMEVSWHASECSLDHTLPRLDPFPNKGGVPRAASGGLPGLGKQLLSGLGRIAGQGPHGPPTHGSHLALLELRVAGEGRKVS